MLKVALVGVASCICNTKRFFRGGAVEKDSVDNTQWEGNQLTGVQHSRHSVSVSVSAVHLPDRDPL